jgi:hypothetical protein
MVGADEAAFVRSDRGVLRPRSRSSDGGRHQHAVRPASSVPRPRQAPSRRHPRARAAVTLVSNSTASGAHRAASARAGSASAPAGCGRLNDRHLRAGAAYSVAISRPVPPPDQEQQAPGCSSSAAVESTRSESSRSAAGSPGWAGGDRDVEGHLGEFAVVLDADGVRPEASRPCTIRTHGARGRCQPPVSFSTTPSFHPAAVGGLIAGVPGVEAAAGLVDHAGGVEERLRGMQPDVRHTPPGFARRSMT